MKQQLSAQIIIIGEQNSVLVLSETRQDEGAYGLPGCIISFGDDPKDAVAQVLLTEMEVKKEFRLVDTTSFLETPKEQKIILIYEVRLESRLVPTGGARWVKLSEIHQFKFTKLAQAALETFTGESITEAGLGHGPVNVVRESTSITASNVIIYSDGGSRGNPGPSAAGFVILNNEGELLFEGGKYLGITTNNQAEYQAVRMGLERALELGARSVDFRMDSLLIVNQMAGIYKIRNRDLWPIYAHIRELIKRFDRVKFTHVRREFNKDADAMVNKILDEHRG